MNYKNLFSSTLLLIATALVVYTIATIGINYRSKSALQLEQLWRSDIKTLRIENKLPSYWGHIRQVIKLTAPTDNRAQSWLKDVSLPIDINPEGEYKLEILFVSDFEDGHRRALIRHHFIHIPTGNSVWEVSRTYNLDH